MDLLDLLESAAARGGTIVFPDSPTTPVSIGALWGDAEQVGPELARSAGENASIAMVLTPSRACLTNLFAAIRSGVRVGSLPLPGRAMSVDDYLQQTQAICAQLGTSTLLVDAEYLALLDGDYGLDIRAHQAVRSTPGAAPAGAAGPGSIVQFSSGSTATPKGIPLSTSAVGHNVQAILEVLEPEVGDVAVSWLPLSHDMGLVGMCLASLCSAADPWAISPTLVLLKPEQFMTSPAIWIESMSRFGATFTAAPNFAFDLACRARDRGEGPDLRRLRVCISGAERLRPATLRRFSATFEPAGFSSTAFCPAYGLAEAVLAVTMVRPAADWSSRAVDTAALADGRWVEGGAGDLELIGNGPVLPGTEVRIAGGSAGGSDGGSDIGVIEVRSPALVASYLDGRPARSDDGWLRTGDLGRLIDGELYIAGRTDDQLTVAGRNLHAVDLEHEVATHAVVRAGNCAVIALDNELAVVAETRSEPAELDAAALEVRTALSTRFGVSPRRVVFVTPGTLPKTPSGKLQRFRIAGLLAADGFEPVYARAFGRR